jgi:hypothetical protein
MGGAERLADPDTKSSGMADDVGGRLGLREAGAHPSGIVPKTQQMHKQGSQRRGCWMGRGSLRGHKGGPE